MEKIDTVLPSLGLLCLLSTVWAGQAHSGRSVRLSDCGAVPVTVTVAHGNKNWIERETEQKQNNNQVGNSLVKQLIPPDTVHFGASNNTRIAPSPPFQLCRALASAEREEGLCPCSLCLPTRESAIDRCHATLSIRGAISGPHAQHWLGIANPICGRRPSLQCRTRRSACRVGQARRLNQEAARRKQRERIMFQVVPPTTSGSSPGAKGRPSLGSGSEASSNGFVPPAAGRGQSQQEEGGRVIGSSRANEGGFWWIPHRHSPAGAYPATQVRP